VSVPRRQPERAEQQAIVRLLRTLGCAVYVLGTTRPRGDYGGTCQTPGMPDLYVFLPHGAALWIEVKAPKGRPRPEQLTFREHCLGRGHHHIMGGLDAVIAWLIEHHYLTAQQVPHYRLPKGA